MKKSYLIAAIFGLLATANYLQAGNLELSEDGNYTITTQIVKKNVYNIKGDIDPSNVVESTPTIIPLEYDICTLTLKGTALSMEDIMQQEYKFKTKIGQKDTEVTFRFEHDTPQNEISTSGYLKGIVDVSGYTFESPNIYFPTVSSYYGDNKFTPEIAALLKQTSKNLGEYVPLFEKERNRAIAINFDLSFGK